MSSASKDGARFADFAVGCANDALSGVKFTTPPGVYSGGGFADAFAVAAALELLREPFSSVFLVSLSLGGLLALLRASPKPSNVSETFREGEDDVDAFREDADADADADAGPKPNSFSFAPCIMSHRCCTCQHKLVIVCVALLPTQEDTDGRTRTGCFVPYTKSPRVKQSRWMREVVKL